MKQILVNKNAQIKQLRSKLGDANESEDNED